MKKIAFVSLIALIGFFTITTSSVDDSNLGGCTVGCGVVGLTGYSLKEYKFISKSD